MDFAEFFTRATAGGCSARQWQRRLGEDITIRNRLIRVSTGLGKTAGVLTAWLWNAVSEIRTDTPTHWPRRLVWCLPMRVLVEQTSQVARQIVDNADLAEHVGVHVLMGGLEPDEWHLHPERPAILIGTQDMLLSRALNRGYAAGRARWPQEFGLLNHDCLWVMDEVQLMDVGLATSAQLQAIRDETADRGLRPCFTWWMSATLQPDWLHSVDTAAVFEDWCREPCEIPPGEQSGGVWEITKPLSTTEVAAKDPEAFASLILEQHTAIEPAESGRITLVICNTVERASETHAALQKAGRNEGLELIHSRFRPHERKAWSEFLNRDACNADADRIIVATQVVEAGVDLSAACLVTELAPWPSLVQRFGRCARYAGSGNVVVVDRGMDAKLAAPYEVEALASAWHTLQSLDDVGIRSLEQLEAGLDDGDRRALYPYSPQHLLMPDEFVELFDTTPDLTGADVDISRFIRSGDERDLQVFWIDIEKSAAPDARRQPQRDELCAVPFLAARDWLCGAETKSSRKPKLRGSMRAWVWDWLEGEWTEARRDMLLPGRLVCVAADCGGYLPTSGFSPDSKQPVPILAAAFDLSPEAEADTRSDTESLSHSPADHWKSIALHSQEVAEEVAGIAGSLGLPDRFSELLQLAATWHDLGKSHPAFQAMLKSTETEPRPDRPDLAKGPDASWVRQRSQFYCYQPDGTDDVERRPGFRHELASSLALFAVLRAYAPDHPALLGPWGEVLETLGRTRPELFTSASIPDAIHPEIQRVIDCSADEFDLLAFLVASHHGKVRVALHAAPADQDYRPRAEDHRGLPIRGVRSGDVLPAIALTPNGPLLPELTLTLEPASLGLSFETGASWRERVQGLIDRHGVATLGFLEAILRSADVRASQRTTPDFMCRVPAESSDAVR